MYYSAEDYDTFLHNFGNDYYEVLKYVIDTTPARESSQICESLFCDYLYDNFDEGQAEQTHAILCDLNDDFFRLLERIEHDGEAGRRRIFEKSLCTPMRYLRQMLNEDEGSEAEIIESIAFHFRLVKFLLQARTIREESFVSKFETGCVSVKRLGLSRKENKERIEKLREEMRVSPYDFIEAQGVFVARKGSEDYERVRNYRELHGLQMTSAVTVKEQSFYLLNLFKTDDLHKFLKGKMEQCEQENFLFTEPAKHGLGPIGTATLFFSDGGTLSLARKINDDFFRTWGEENLIEALLKAKAEYSRCAKGTRHFLVHEYEDSRLAQKDFILGKAIDYDVLLEVLESRRADILPSNILI